MHLQGGISPSELTSILVDFLESHSFDSLEASTVRHIDTKSREHCNYDGSDSPNIKGTEETNGNIKEEVIIPTTSNSPLSTDMDAKVDSNTQPEVTKSSPVTVNYGRCPKEPGKLVFIQLLFFTRYMIILKHLSDI